MNNIVAIVGRPNVGKSTLFNRLIEQRKAIMDDESGVTRDRHYGFAEWNGKFFTAIDTGGYVTGSEDIFEKAIQDQVKAAISEATVIVFMVDCFDGLTGLDQDFANVIRGIKKPVIIAANKADNTERSFMVGEFYALGISDEIHAISSANGSGTGELLDAIVEKFPEVGVENPEEGIPKLAILGRPNVGKSSFINALLGEERSIVTDISGTTRDAINSRYNRFGKDFILVDTAGLRRKSRVKEDIEFYSVMRSIQALQDSDVCVVMLDARQGLESQDMNIISLAHKHKRGIMIMVNKWDLVEKDNKTQQAYMKVLQEKLGPLAYIPIVFTSVLTKQRIYKAIQTAIDIYENKQVRISTSMLNDRILPEIERYPPPAIKGKYIKIKYITQLPTQNPTFAFFCNLPQYIKEGYIRYLEKQIRQHFGFSGVPINLIFRKK